MPMEEFLSGIDAVKAIDHEHLTCLWASYVHHDCGYLLVSPVHDSNLKSFLTTTPQSIKILAKQDRRILCVNWLHCLASALSSLHKLGLAHKSIRPSNVLLDVDNQIFLGDTGAFSTASEGDKRGFDKETYDYSAPEQASNSRPSSYVPVYLPMSRPSTVKRATFPGNGGASIYFPAPSVSGSSSNDSASILTDSTGSYGSSSPPNDGLSKKHDPQQADIFSLGTIFLEILTFLLKRASRNFASHRSAKNKTPGRGGGLPDSSFHKNLGQVESWMNTLTKDASKKEDILFRGISHIITLTTQMLSVHPEDRPTASEVQERLYKILSNYSGLGAAGEGLESRLHCDSRRVKVEDWNFGFEELRLQSQRAAAEACAAVALSNTEVRTIPLGNGGVIYGVARRDTTSTIIPQSPGRGGDEASFVTRTSSGSAGKSRASGSVNGGGMKVKPKAKAWQAPVYAGELRFSYQFLLIKTYETGT